jgi:hypothetical protein
MEETMKTRAHFEAASERADNASPIKPLLTFMVTKHCGGGDKRETLSNFRVQ